MAVPAWGERCLSVLERHTVPALVAALAELARAVPRPLNATIWVATDDGARVQRAFDACGAHSAVLRLTGVPGPDNSFMSMSNHHRQVMSAAGRQDRVLLLTADMVLSREVLATCEYHASRGAGIVCCVAPRALEDAFPPSGATGRELLEWAWTNRHPMTRDCTWPAGESYDVWRMYFESGDEVGARVFLPHPLVVVPGGRRLNFSVTIDVNLTMNFPQSATHLITSPEEGAAVEISPRDKDYLKTTTMRERLDAGGPSCPPFIRATNARHRMFFGKRVVIRGAGGDCGDGEVVERVMG